MTALLVRSWIATSTSGYLARNARSRSGKKPTTDDWLAASRTVPDTAPLCLHFANEQLQVVVNLSRAGKRGLSGLRQRNAMRRANEQRHAERLLEIRNTAA